MKLSVKMLPVIIVCLVSAATLSAQSAASSGPSHGLVTLKVTWSRETSASAPRPSADEVSLPSRRQNPNADPVDKLRGSSSVPSSRQPGQHFYVYSLKVRNDSGKNIRGVYWDYVASDRSNGAELNRRHVINIQKVSRGEVATLRMEYPSPPTNVVTPGGLGKDERSPFTSSADIRCVLYDDGTTWRTEGGEAQCAELHEADRARERKAKH
jgi:hypothetical protein